MRKKFKKLTRHYFSFITDGVVKEYLGVDHGNPYSAL